MFCVCCDCWSVLSSRLTRERRVIIRLCSIPKEKLDSIFKLMMCCVGVLVYEVCYVPRDLLLVMRNSVFCQKF